MRTYSPKWGADSANFAMLNRGKKSVALDLKDEAARARLRPLIERADIVVEQFRPGVMARLGLGYDDIRAIRPDIIYCSITGYGQTGPGAARAGHDLNYIGDTGLLALSCGTADTPVIPPALIADIAGGTYPAVLNILLALRQPLPLPRLGAGRGAGDRRLAGQWRRAGVGRLVPLSPLPDLRRTLRRGRGAGAEILARLLRRDRP
jgi:crotonobetainyl-CoA:carnitine CoA-transferase CaiB-like acyl-CoA transferase